MKCVFVLKSTMSDKATINSSDISWYSMDENLKTQENGIVSLPEAVNIINRYFSNLKPRYETGEEALTDTMFGFCRTSDTFIEICIHNASEVAFKFEMRNTGATWYQKLFAGVEQYEETLKSRETLIARVENFFANSPKDYYRILKNKNV